MMKYRVNILDECKKAGYSTYYLQKHHILSQNVIQYLRDGKLISLSSLEIICQLLNCQPGDLLEHVPDKIVHTEIKLT